MRERFKFRNAGFSLVELIIVIAIMAILAAAIAPALIRYISKSRKADDMAAGDSIGTTLGANYAENEEVYRYISQRAADLQSGGNANGYAILCVMKAGDSTNGFTLVQSGDTTLDNDAAPIAKKLVKELMGDTYYKMRFTDPTYLNQWILAVDAKENLAVFVCGGGAGVSEITDGHMLSGGSNSRAFKVWPSVDTEYNAMNTAPNSYITN